MEMVSISATIMLLQLVPIFYLIWWGYCNHKLSEYYTWIKFMCRVKSALPHFDPQAGFSARRWSTAVVDARRPSL